VRNKDARPSAYEEMAIKYRPSHADYTYEAKYGLRNWQGGGRSSARETIGRVAAAAVAKQLIESLVPDLTVVGYVKTIHDLTAEVDPNTVTREQVEQNPVRTPDPLPAEKMIERIKQVRAQGNSLAGIVECVVRGCLPGLGEPVFDKLEADLAKGMLSLPATKGFEIGSGFAGTLLTGAQHNDPYVIKDQGRVGTSSNRSGGIQGGISNGEPIFFRVAFKPTATIMSGQQTVSTDNQTTELKGRGRHDACVLPRAVPMVEAMTYLILADHLLRHRAQLGSLGDQRPIADTAPTS